MVIIHGTWGPGTYVPRSVHSTHTPVQNPYGHIYPAHAIFPPHHIILHSPSIMHIHIIPFPLIHIPHGRCVTNEPNPAGPIQGETNVAYILNLMGVKTIKEITQPWYIPIALAGRFLEPRMPQVPNLCIYILVNSVSILRL